MKITKSHIDCIAAGFLTGGFMALIGAFAIFWQLKIERDNACGAGASMYYKPLWEDTVLIWSCSSYEQIEFFQQKRNDQQVRL